MAEWVRRLVGLVLLLGFLELLLPPGETSRFARLVVGFALLLAVLQPLVSLGDSWTLPSSLSGLELPRLREGPSFHQARDRGYAAFRASLERVQAEAEDRREKAVRRAVADLPGVTGVRVEAGDPLIVRLELTGEAPSVLTEARARLLRELEVSGEELRVEAVAPPPWPPAGEPVREEARAR